LPHPYMAHYVFFRLKFTDFEPNPMDR